MKHPMFLLVALCVTAVATSAYANQQGACTAGKDIRVFLSPARPNAQGPLRLMVVHGGERRKGNIWVQHPNGTQHQLSTRRFGGPPHGFVATVESPAAGVWRAGLVVDGDMQTCKRFKVRKNRIRLRGKRAIDESSVWTTYRRWTPHLEDLYSLWIEHLFAAPIDQEPTWSALHVVLQDPTRNLLYDHLSIGEDTPGRRARRLKPDCADFPYFLRGYFAWKLSLPFGYRRCWQSRRHSVAHCQEAQFNDQPAQESEPADAFFRLLKRGVGWAVNSSNGRTAYNSKESDFYPIPITRHSVRPGTVYADPYGHLLIVSQLVEGQAGEPGILFAVDAQPDATIGRRRFWRGSFLFPPNASSMGAGFKRFRPVMKFRGEIRPMENWRIKRYPGYRDLDFQQETLTPDTFYDAVDGLTNIQPLTPQKALEVAVIALAEQVRRRVVSVDNAEVWKSANPSAVIQMPKARKLFQTSGPWEDYSTPSRDMRLLIAIDTVANFPDSIRRTPQRFGLSDPQKIQSTQKALRDQLMTLTQQHRFTYQKSNGSTQSLTVYEVIQRRIALEMAYNPNDCPEIRWGAPKNSPEAESCNQRAPDIHQKRMASYRPWFHRRVRPTAQDPFPEAQ